MKVLLTGGCGYIGAHCSHLLAEAGHQVSVIDNLSLGQKNNLLLGEKLYIGDFGDQKFLNEILAEGFDAVLHFAASTDVTEATYEPARYYDNNAFKTRLLVQACIDHGVKNFILSSTCAVYGDGPPDGLVSEHSPLKPVGVYGWSKLFAERLLIDLAAGAELRYSILRYFNVAGKRVGLPFQFVGKDKALIQRCALVSKDPSQTLLVYGDSFDTPDGTAIRDYIHVQDLVEVHGLILDLLAAGHSKELILNVGYGRGFSVREVIACFEQITGRPLAVKVEARRSGEAERVIAITDFLSRTLSWQPRYADLGRIVEDTLA